MTQPTVYLLSCGDELLFGHTVDTNSAWLAQECSILGYRVVGHRTIGDVTPDIVAAFKEAASKADVVILTGGLGPTADDRTRHALAEALGVPLEENAQALKEIELIFQHYNRTMGDINRVQALIPKGAARIYNPHGTAPGIHARLLEAEVFVMPGVPREMREMFTETVKPELLKRPSGAYETLRRLHLTGTGESDIGDAIRHLMGEKSNPEVGTAVAEGIITVRIYAKGATREEADSIAAQAEADIRRVLGEHIFAVDGETLQQTVVQALRENDAILSLAESCTGGMIAGLIVDVPGSSDVFVEGIVSYSNAAKINRLGVPAETIEKYGAVSRETVTAMAEGVLRKGGFTHRPGYSLAVTGIAGPDGGTPEKPVGTVWIACSSVDKDGNGLTRAMLYNTLADRYGVRLRSAHAAMDLLRRVLGGLPISRRIEETTWKI